MNPPKPLTPKPKIEVDFLCNIDPLAESDLWAKTFDCFAPTDFDFHQIVSKSKAEIEMAFADNEKRNNKVIENSF